LRPLPEPHWLKELGRGLLSTGFFLLVWFLIAHYANSRLAPGPVQVWREGVGLWLDGSLAHNLWVTLLRVAASFVLAILVGTALGVGLARFATLDWLVGPWLTVGLNLPALVLIVLAFVWMGLNEPATIVAVAANKIPTVAVIVRAGARSVDPTLTDVARAFDLSRWRTFSRIYAPQLYPYLLAAARTGLALVWKIVLVAELIGRSDGIGFEIAVRFQQFDIAGILAFSFAFVLVVAIVEVGVFQRLDTHIRRWQ
jgi:NitT/TauT family transport system permease protein